MKWEERYNKNFVNLEWKDKQEPVEHLLAYKSPLAKLDDIPIMFIGVGGTGIDAVMTLKGKLEAAYNPERIQHLEYLLIDTDKISERKNINKADTIVIQSTDTAILLNEARNNGKNSFIPEEIRSWLDVTLSPFRIMNGAAGIRQAGRLILFLNFNKIYDALRQKLNRIRENYDGCECRARVYLFTGIGGGTGSGMFVDLSYMIRSLVENVDLEGVIFMPDVTCLKPNLREVHRQNIKRNGFAALKELDYLMTLDRFHEEFCQKYPGNIAVRSGAPIFDFCILVGAQEDGRKPIGCEQEIFEKTAEYVLFEIQAKEGHGLESYKSNIVNMMPQEPFCERYAAIGAAAKYMPIDYYYGWWLKDIFEMLKSRSDIFYEDVEGKITDEFSKRAQSNSGWRKKKLLKIWQEDLEKVRDGDGLLPGEGEMYALLMLWDTVEKNPNDKINNKIKEITKKKPETVKWNRILHFFRWRKIQKCYRQTFGDAYACDLNAYEKSAKKINGILNIIIQNVDRYNIYKTQKPSDQYEVWLDEFKMIAKQQAYQSSLKTAALKIAKDIMKNYERWQGLASGTPKWLSDYLAELVWDEFSESGLMSMEELILYAACNGYNGQEEYIHDLLSGLDVRQMWPRSSAYPKQDNFHRVLSAPNDIFLKEWIEEWNSKSGAMDVFSPSEIFGRFARAIIVPGNALYSYDGIGDFEQEYLNAANTSGLHLYAGGINWKNLPSPYFETKWRAADAGIRAEEKKRNDYYRGIFEVAVEKGIIIDSKVDYYYILGDKIGRPGNKKIEIGDIAKADKETAKNMFIHMFTWRSLVEEELKRELGKEELERKLEKILKKEGEPEEQKEPEEKKEDK